MQNRHLFKECCKYEFMLIGLKALEKFQVNLFPKHFRSFISYSPVFINQDLLSRYATYTGLYHNNSKAIALPRSVPRIGLKPKYFVTHSLWNL